MKAMIKSVVDLSVEAGKIAIEGWKDLIFDLYQMMNDCQVRP